MSITENNSESQLILSADELSLRASFPTDFLWGVATSAYQIEGAVHEDGRGDSIWDYFSHLPGKIYQNENADVAVDHYHRTQDDVALMAHLGLNSYRFSLAWPRILPEGTGKVNQAGLDFYDHLIDQLLAKGITPLVTLYHWDLPLHLHEQGGWTNRDTAYAFADYAEVVAQRLGDRVDNWITHNEPWCAAFLGYGSGVHAPGIKDLQASVDAAHHILLSHGLAVPRIRAHIRPTAKVGIAPNLYPVYAADASAETQKLVQKMDAFKNGWFLDPIFKGSYPEHLFADMHVSPPPIQSGDMALISSPIDVLGINYYSRTVMRGSEEQLARNIVDVQEVPAIPGSDYTVMNWEVFPQGLEDILRQVQEKYAPRSIFITENGCASDDTWNGSGAIRDTQRLSYLREHIRAISRAREAQVPVDGYYAWSLLDNYEWAEGYNKRFGIVYVDYATQQRVVKESGAWYRAFIRARRSRPEV